MRFWREKVLEERGRREDKIFVLCLKRLNCDQLSLKSVCGSRFLTVPMLTRGLGLCESLDLLRSSSYR